MTLTAPRLLDAKNLPLSSASAGQQLVVAVNLANNSNAKELPFVGIIEVRNADGVTVMFRWQSGTLTPDGDLDIAASWVPEAAGDYSVRTFVVTGLRNVQVLSEVTESKVTIN